MNNNGVFHIDVNTTKNCNLRCKYCYEVKQNNIEDKTFKEIDGLVGFIDGFIESDYYINNHSGLSINFWGGEPTLNKELFDVITTRYKYDNRVVFFMYSNGFHVSDYFIDKLLDLQKMTVFGGVPKIMIQISYDGIPIHDIDRITIDGKGSSLKVVDTILKFKSIGIKYVIKSTIKPQDFKYMYDAYVDVIKYHNSYFPTIDLHDELMVNGDIDYHDFDDDLMDSLVKIASHEIRNNNYVFKWFIGSRALCVAGAHMLAVDINGNIQPCHGGLYTCYDEHTISNVNDKDVITKVIDSCVDYKSIHGNEPDKCKQCTNGFCLRCNTAHFEFSDKKTYKEKWVDFDNQDYLCNYFDIVDKVSRSVKYIKNNG